MMRARFLLAAVAAALAVTPPALAAGHQRLCNPHAGALAGGHSYRIWHSRGSLYGCSSDGDRATTLRLGPWASGSRFVWDGEDVT